MMTTDETQIQIALGFLDSCTDDRTGFLPSQAPIQDLPPAFAKVSSACRELSSRYHGEDKNCRPWLEETFAEPDPSWQAALRECSPHVLGTLMTETSLLCHAFLCQNAQGQGVPDHARLPAGLDWLWGQTAELLDVPKVGNFFAMLTSNWQVDGVTPGESYELSSITDGTPHVLHRWLGEPLVQDLEIFIGSFLAMEAKGAKLLTLIREIFDCILTGNSQEATYHMMVLSGNISSLSADFYQSFKKSKAAPKGFAKVLHPTLVLGDEKGASGLQSCTFQLLESFFGLNPESDFGQAVLEARELMMPEHRKLLKVVDQSSPIVRAFIESAQSSRLLETYNRCLTHMKTWRLLYVKRGGLLSLAERKTRVETQAPLLEGDWMGKEWSLDSLFRFLTEEQRATLAKRTETIEYKAGEAIIQQGHLFPGLFELVSGSATVKKEVNGMDEDVDTMQIHEVFGEMSLVENLPASASIIADVDLTARQVSLETVYELTNEHRDAEGGFYLALGQLISHRLRNSFPASA